tara:strand:- start:210 stop:1259 length:1050 start_codon:yes stop_codon:yes gene_type:complete
MALQFDMSKNNWQQDLMLQEQMRGLGQDLGTAGALAGGALAKALFPTGGRKIAEKRKEWFTPKTTAKDKFNEAVKDWKARGSKGEKPLLKDFQTDYKFTPGKGIKNAGETLFPNKGKNFGRNVAAATGIGAGLYFNPLSTVLGLGGLFGANKYKDEIKSAAGKFKDRVKKDMSTEYFEGPGLANSPLANLFQKRKSKRLQKQARKKSLTPSTEMSDKYVNERPQDVEFGEVDFGLPSKMYRKTTPMPGLEPLPEFKAPIPRPAKESYTIPAEIEAKRKRDINKMPFNPGVLYSGKEAEARGALMNQIYGPLQSLIIQQQESNPSLELPVTPPDKIRTDGRMDMRVNNPY